MRISADAAVYVISVAADLAGMHPQTLRQYDRLGLVSPERTAGRGRRYSADDIARLQLIQRLSQDEGINLAGIKLIIELREQLEEARAALSEARSELRSMYEAAQRAERATSRSGLSAPSGARGELVHVPRSTQVVLWRPRNERGKE